MFKKVFLGTTPIAKIYLGDKLIKYNIATSIPPKFLSTIPNFRTDVNQAIEMYYRANDDIGIVRHEFYDGTSWQDLYPTPIGDIFYYTLTFDTAGVKQCQIRITDADGNVATSNIFRLTVNQVLPVELIYASDTDNQIYALNRTNLQRVQSIREGGVIGGLLKMDKDLYVVNNNTTTLKRYNDKLQLVERSAESYSQVMSLIGKFRTSSSTNCIFEISTYSILKFTHGTPLSDRHITNDNDGFKYSVYLPSKVYALKTNNHIVIYNLAMGKLKEITDTTHGDFILVDNAHVYKCPHEYGTFKKYSISTGQEVLSASASVPLASGVILGDKLYMIDKHQSSIYIFDKSFKYLQTISVTPKIGCITADEQNNQLYVGTQNGEIWIYSTSDLNNPVAKHSISTKSIQHINLG